MNRRDFIKLTGATSAALATSPSLMRGQSAAPPLISLPTTRPSAAALYGYDRGYGGDDPFILRPGPHLFVDWRYVAPGGISWVGPDGKGVPYFTDKEPKDVT